jgi:hypothetical protein
MSAVSEIEASRMIAEKFRFAVSAVADKYPGAIANAEMQAKSDVDVMRRMVFTMTTWFLDAHKEVRKESRNIDFPASPWQFFKQEYFPAWALKRWPVKYNSTTVTMVEHHHHICPHMVTDNQDKHIMFMYEGMNAKYEAGPGPRV